MSGLVVDGITGGGIYLHDKKIMDVSECDMFQPHEIINIPSHNNVFETQVSVSCDINDDLFNKLCGNPEKYAFEVSYKRMVQARKHRKWRTNKKWLKRYGYKPVTENINGLKAVGFRNGTFELVKENK